MHAFYNTVPLDSPLRKQKNTSSDHFVVSATCREITTKTSRFIPILYYLIIGSPEILSPDKDADKASKRWACIWD